MALKKIIFYSLKRSGKQPFVDWLDDQDKKVQFIVFARIERLTLGNFGDCKRLQNGFGVWEFRINYGAGYRVYFGKKGTQIIILLLGGDKGSQSRDIAKAKRYWLDFKEDVND